MYNRKVRKCRKCSHKNKLLNEKKEEKGKIIKKKANRKKRFVYQARRNKKFISNQNFR